MRLWPTPPALLALSALALLPAGVSSALAQSPAKETPAAEKPEAARPEAEKSEAKKPEDKKSGGSDAIAAAQTPLGDWLVICNPAPSRAHQVCEADISLKPDGSPVPVARVAFYSEGRDKPVKVVAIVQANLSLAPGVDLIADAGKTTLNLPFKSCLNSACLADAMVTPEQLEIFRAGRESSRLVIVNAAGEKLEAGISPKGLKESLDMIAPR